MKSLGERVRDLRLAAGLSQTALAGEDFSPSYVSLIEAGRREPTDGALAVLAARLGTTLEYLRLGEEAPSEARARLEVEYARIDLARAEGRAARERLEGLRVDDLTPALRAEALTVLAEAQEVVGDHLAAVGVLEPLLDDVRRRGRHLEAAGIAMSLTRIYLESGDLVRSTTVGEAQLALLEDAGLAGTDEHLRLGSTLVWAYVERGDVLFAAHRAADLIRVAEGLGTVRGRGSVYWNAALVAEQGRDLELAQRYAESALALLGEGATDKDVPRLRVDYAWLLLRCDPPQPGAAMDQLDLAEEGLRRIGTVTELARFDVERGRARLLLGDPAGAESDVRSALARLGEPARLESANARLALGDVLHARGDAAGATEAYEWAAQALAVMAASRQAAAAWRDLGDRHARAGDVPAAAAAYARALDAAGLRAGAAHVDAAAAWGALR